jgi:hypothetical protein
VSDSNPLFQSVLQGCGTSVSSVVGVELEVSEASVRSTSEPPEGELAVLPMIVKPEPESELTLTLSAPLAEIVTLGRRTLGDEDPESKERELTEDELNAVGQVLNLMGGAVQQALRERVRSDLDVEVGKWWRTDDAGEQRCRVGPGAPVGAR